MPFYPSRYEINQRNLIELVTKNTVKEGQMSGVFLLLLGNGSNERTKKIDFVFFFFFKRQNMNGQTQDKICNHLNERE